MSERALNIVGWEDAYYPRGKEPTTYSSFEDYVTAWQDADDAGDYFHTNVHNMRRAIGANASTYEYEIALGVSAIYKQETDWDDEE